CWAVNGLLLSKIMSWPCPRCAKPFVYSFWNSWPTSHCKHCGLEFGSHHLGILNDEFKEVSEDGAIVSSNHDHDRIRSEVCDMSTQANGGTFSPLEIHLPAEPRTKWQREYTAFRRLLPQLLASERGKYVAVHEEQVIDTDRDEMALIARVLVKIGNVDFHVGLVTDASEPVYRSGVVRNLTT